MSVGTIFSVKEFTLHDGPGIRTTVFFKGCPLRCAWCHNPEGLSPEPELMIRKTLCTGCGKCLRGCAHERCQPFGRCTRICPNGCIEICGERVEARRLADRLRKNAAFFEGDVTHGGVTLSGGEPLMQPAFALELLRELRPLHRVVETSGFADERAFAAIADEADLVLMDLKLMDCEAHSKHTGAPNDLILRNLEQLKATRKPFVVRVPLIPGVSDGEANLSAAARVLADCADRVRVELLPYNELAGAKYESVGREYRQAFAPEATNPHPAEPFSRMGIPVSGG